jgi:hypothetical protein
VSKLSNFDIALNAIEEMVRRKRGYGLQPTEKNLLLSPQKGMGSFEDELGKLSSEDQDLFGVLYMSALYGFFHCAAHGYAFVPATRIKQEFGKTLEENYASAYTTPAFMGFATSYWTLKIITIDERSTDDRLWLHVMLGKLEFDISSLFFPTPSSLNFSIPAKQREETQRMFLLESGASINIEEFIAGNPILQQHKKRQSSTGCLVVLLAIGAIAISMCLVIVIMI